MNYGNNFSEYGVVFPVRKHVLSPVDPAIYKLCPITICPPIAASSNARIHCHRLVELIVTFGGARAEITLDGADNTQSRLSLDEYQCCLMPAGVCHAITVENPHHQVSLFVDDGAVSESLSECVPGVVVESLRKLAWCDSFTGQLIAELDGRETIYSESILTHSMLTALAVKVIDGFLRIRKEAGEGSKNGLCECEQKRALAYIETNLETKFCVRLLAKHMTMSLPHFNRRFRAAFGMPPLQYALKLRVDKALDLLRTGNTRVAEAAFSAGFCDQSHFDRHCRKFYGFPPGALIRAAR